MMTAASSGRRLVPGYCPLHCPDTCSWEVTVEDGRAISLHGTRDHPFTRGSLCVKVNGYLDHMHAPDRLLYPMRRVGPKGAGRFERTTWDAALSEFADRLRKVIATGGGEAIGPCAGCGSMGHLQGLNGVGQRLWNAIGASIHEPTICHHAGSFGTRYTMGSRHGLDPETMDRSRLI